MDDWDITQVPSIILIPLNPLYCPMHVFVCMWVKEISFGSKRSSKVPETVGQTSKK